MDRNGNGVVDSGAELFGNFTPQPPSPEPNGFIALAEYDTNHDNRVDSNDPIFTSLRLWQDTNHDGVSPSSELKTLVQLGLTGIATTYKKSKKTDQYGNRFLYRAKAYNTHNSQIARWAWDVYLK